MSWCSGAFRAFSSFIFHYLLSPKTLAKKMTVLYKLAREQLSKQHHYDFGLRALKSVLVMAGELKRGSPELREVGATCMKFCGFSFGSRVFDQCWAGGDGEQSSQGKGFILSCHFTEVSDLRLGSYSLYYFLLPWRVTIRSSSRSSWHQHLWCFSDNNQSTIAGWWGGGDGVNEILEEAWISVFPSLQ